MLPRTIGGRASIPIPSCGSGSVSVRDGANLPPAARTALLAITGSHAKAAAAYGEAISRAQSRAETLFLEKRLADLLART